MGGLPPNSRDLSFGNSVYKIRFEERYRRPVYGDKYWFYLKDAVDDVPEYIVHWDHFVKCVFSLAFPSLLLSSPICCFSFPPFDFLMLMLIVSSI